MLNPKNLIRVCPLLRELLCKRLTNKRGLGLVAVLLGMVIVGMTTVPITKWYLSLNDASIKTEERMQAQSFAFVEWQKVLAEDYDTLSSKAIKNVSDKFDLKRDVGAEKNISTSGKAKDVTITVYKKGTNDVVYTLVSAKAKPSLDEYALRSSLKDLVTREELEELLKKKNNNNDEDFSIIGEIHYDGSIEPVDCSVGVNCRPPIAHWSTNVSFYAIIKKYDSIEGKEISSPKYLCGAGKPGSQSSINSREYAISMAKQQKNEVIEQAKKQCSGRNWYSKWDGTFKEIEGREGSY